MEMGIFKTSKNKEISQGYFQWDRKKMETNKIKIKYIQEVLQII